MSRPSITVHHKLKIFLWVQSAKVSPLTRLGRFFLLQGSQGWKLPASQRGALKPRWHRRGGRSLLSCELYGLKSGCQSAVIAQWEWAPPLGQSASERAAINKLSTLSPKPVRLEPQGARSLNFPKHCPLLGFFFYLLFMFAEICWPSCHTSPVVISLKAILVPPTSFYITSALSEYVCVHFSIRPTCTTPSVSCHWSYADIIRVYRIFWGIWNDVIQRKPPRSTSYCECDETACICLHRKMCVDRFHSWLYVTQGLLYEASRE